MNVEDNLDIDNFYDFWQLSGYAVVLCHNVRHISKITTVRAKVEHVFAVVKRLFGYRKTRYQGLRKQTAKLNIMFAPANLYLADRKSLTA